MQLHMHIFFSFYEVFLLLPPLTSYSCTHMNLFALKWILIRFIYFTYWRLIVTNAGCSFSSFFVFSNLFLKITWQCMCQNRCTWTCYSWKCVHPSIILKTTLMFLYVLHTLLLFAITWSIACPQYGSFSIFFFFFYFVICYAHA